jgi:hypothetical protein
MIRITLIIVFGLILQFSLNAQTQYPSKVNWTEIKTPHFKILCPDEISEKGQSTANLLESVYFPVTASLYKPPKPITLILNNQSVISNGYVTLMPRYMSWYITPFQDATSSVDGSDWFQNLATHEFRHVVQFDKIDTGIVKFAGYVLGDFGRMLATVVSTPFWFMEGDAVYSETTHSYGGRGRLPSFLRDNMAIEMENKHFNYDKAYLGSYRDHVPNHYHLGYMLCSQVNKNYGDHSWNYVLNTSSKYAYSPFAFSSALKTSTGFDLDKTYENTIYEYDSLWQDALSRKRTIEIETRIVAEESGKTWTNYTFPYEINENHFLALKYGLSNTSTLVLISNGKEKNLTQLSENDRVQSNGKKVVWSTTYPDIRWGQKEYADIIVFDIISREQKRLTHSQRYFAPAISPLGNKIATIEYTSDMKCSIVILDAQNGQVLDKYTVNDKEFLRMPSWSDDETKLVLTRTCGQYKTLSVYDLNSRNLINLMDYSTENITNPVFYKNHILFNTPLSDFDEIHAYDTISKKRYCMVTGKYGVYNPSVSLANNTLTYQNYSVKGFCAERVKIDSLKWIELPDIFRNTKNYLNYCVAGSDTEFKVSDASEDTVYYQKKYMPVFHSLKIHTWSPVLNPKGIGAQIVSNDYLNTTSISAGAVYYPADAAHREFVNFSYAGLYPVFNAVVSDGNKYIIQKDNKDSSRYRRINEKLYDLNVSLPLNLSRNNHVSYLTLEGGYLSSWLKYYPDSAFERVSVNEKLAGWYCGTEYYIYQNSSLQDINPPLGLYFLANYLKTLSYSEVKGSRVVLQGNIYLPGFAPHNSINVTGGYQHFTKQSFESIYLSETGLLPVMGKQESQNDKFPTYKKIGVMYTLPIAYPDYAIPSWLYCKRIYANLFYDYGEYSINDYTTKQQTVGFDLKFNFNIVRLLPTLDMGIRFSHRLNDNKNQIEILLFNLPLY